ncbi:MAG: zinc ribbon domain-containing protein [Kiritimatiellales bacterium]
MVLEAVVFQSTTSTGVFAVFGQMFRLAILFSITVGVWRKFVKHKEIPDDSRSAPVNGDENAEAMSFDGIEDVETFPEQKKNCSFCGVSNFSSARFCESCGAGFFQKCPDCEEETYADQKYCIVCGADKEGFLIAQQILENMLKAEAQKNLQQVIEESEKINGIQLSGPKGEKLKARIEQMSQRAQKILSRCKEMEIKVEKGCSSLTGNNCDQLLYLLNEYEYLMPLPERLQVLKTDVLSRCAIKRKKEIKTMGILIAIVGLLVLGIYYFSLPFFYIGEFRNAIARRQIERAQTLAAKVGDRYDTSGELNSLKNFISAKTQYTSISNDVEQVKKFYVSEWNIVRGLITEAERLGDLQKSAVLYEQASARILNAVEQINEMFGAKERCEQINGIDLIKVFYGSEWRVIQELTEEAEAFDDPQKGIILYEQISVRIANAIEQVNEMLVAKERCEKIFENTAINQNLVRKYAPKEWADAQSLLATAKKNIKPQAMIENYNSAEQLLRSAINKTKQTPVVVVLTCNAQDFAVFENGKKLKC